MKRVTLNRILQLHRITDRPSKVLHPLARQLTPYVLFSGCTPAGISGFGKMTPQFFLPPFSRELSKFGYGTRIAVTRRQLKTLSHAAALVVYIYNEDYAQLDSSYMHEDLATDPHIPCINLPSTSHVVSDKTLTSAMLSKAGIPVPEVQQPAGASHSVFSRSRFGSRLDANVVDPHEELSPHDDKILTRFIDTRVEFGKKCYFTVIRVLAIGKCFMSAVVFARDAAANSASVHALDTPLDTVLLDFLQQKLVDEREGELTELCEKVGQVLGNGFWHIDILVDNSTNQMYVCEVGIKFHNMSFFAHIHRLKSIPASVARNLGRDYPATVARAIYHQYLHGAPVASSQE